MFTTTATLTFGHEVELAAGWRTRRLRGMDLRHEAGSGVVTLRAYTDRGSESRDALSIPVEEIRRLARLLDRIADEAGPVVSLSGLRHLEAPAA